MGRTKTQQLACSGCKSIFSRDDVVFECLNKLCPIVESDDELAQKRLFTVARFRPRVRCPYCSEWAYVKRCPECYAMLPVGMGSDHAMLAVVGARTSGKTCFITSLIRQIKMELSREDAYGMALEWQDPNGQKYFRETETDIFRQNVPPRFTQAGTPVSMQITVRFALRGLKRWTTGTQGVVSLIFPDPAGDHFHTMEDPAFLSYLANADAIMLMVDPLTEEGYRDMLVAENRPLPDYASESSHTALQNMVTAIRSHLGKEKGKLNKSLAVVVTKCDEYGVFDPDDDRERYPPQGRRYSPRFSRDISNRVKRFIHDELHIPGLVALANESFAHVRYFAASALGSPPQNGVLINPNPRRVEEPLLWILHRWGYI